MSETEGLSYDRIAADTSRREAQRDSDEESGSTITLLVASNHRHSSNQDNSRQNELSRQEQPRNISPRTTSGSHHHPYTNRQSTNRQSTNRRRRGFTHRAAFRERRRLRRLQTSTSNATLQHERELGGASQNPRPVPGEHYEIVMVDTIQLSRSGPVPTAEQLNRLAGSISERNIDALARGGINATLYRSTLLTESGIHVWSPGNDWVRVPTSTISTGSRR